MKILLLRPIFGLEMQSIYSPAWKLCLSSLSHGVVTAAGLINEAALKTLSKAGEGMGLNHRDLWPACVYSRSKKFISAGSWTEKQ